MKKKLEEAIKALAEKATSAKSAPEALNYTQAALNAAHTMQVLVQIEKL